MDSIIFYSKIKEFLRERNPEIATLEFDENTNLIQYGIIDSFAVVELIMFIEDFTGKSLEVERLNANSIKTLQSIYNFFISHNRE